MWVAKLKVSSERTLIGIKGPKYSVDIFGFPLSYFYTKDWIIVNIIGIIFGKDENKREFLRDLKKEKRVVNFEINDDFFIGTIKEPIYTKAFYNSDIIYVAPIHISNEGFQLITIGAFKREPLMSFIKIMERKYKSNLISIQQKKIKSISIAKIRPELTKKQRGAMELAIKNGYYHSPRKTDVKELARVSGLAFSTYQVHLRKAEEKLIPYFFE